MKSTITNPAHWRLATLLSLDLEEVHELARVAAGTLTTYRLVLGRCLLALHHSKGYKTYGCSSAVHYAATVLGLNPSQARTCRRVADRLRELPELTLAAELGSIAWSKLREIVRKASPETESFWIELARSRSYKEIEALVRRTPKGSLPGDRDRDLSSVSSELRCQLSDEVFAMLSQARRAFSLEKGEAVTTAEVLEWALASYISSQPADADSLEKVRKEADKDLQAERAREMPLIAEARELAEKMGLLCEAETEAPTREDPLIQALGSSPLTQQGWPARAKKEQVAWKDIRLRFNPQSRHATKAQKKEILRRDGWCCSAPGCPHKVWLHLHHLKPYSHGGTTERSNLLCLCAGCHRNLHRGSLEILPDSDGKLLFFDCKGQRLDRQADLEVAGWLDFWFGWTGKKGESRTAKAHSNQWELHRPERLGAQFQKHLPCG